MDMGDYFSRIHYNGSSEKCDHQTLKDILIHHIRAVPFEGLSIHCEEAIDLDIEAIYKKIVWKGRGGWCFEQNHLLFWALKTMGYEVTMLGANVYLPLQQMYSSNLSHLVLKVVVDGRAYLVDGSYGSEYQMWEPMLLISGRDQPQVPGTFRLTAINGVWHFDKVKRKQYVLGDKVPDFDLQDKAECCKVYRFTLEERMIEHFLPMNSLLQTSPESLFRKKSYCSLQLTNGVRALVGLKFTEMKYNHKDNMDLMEFTKVKEEEMEMILREKFNLILGRTFVPVNIGGIYLL
ncbi:arylamine N-acetyltransferase, pineal gland isozyme NAT-3-like [Ambystoma mexicanum]|uniref:arylamine N-acetyltransferase, pineal gland isozyme NAT-3-like n=1 Tax=Ambystoma mexicanum TaxID=8296 RepID=UPI0037E88E05